jgi:ketosteroid isomerase-like protein
MSDATRSLEERVRVLEDRAELRELVTRYGLAVDDRDIETLASLFTLDARFRSRDGVMNAVGREAVVQQFRGRFGALGPTNHVAHEQICSCGAERDSASGIVTSHAEVWRNGRGFIAALRYEDSYRREDGRWRFADRLLSFFYYLPIDEYAKGLGERLRVRVYGDERPADFPEALPTWRTYHGEG